MNENRNWMQTMMTDVVGGYEDSEDTSQNKSRFPLRKIRKLLLRAVVLAIALQMLYSAVIYVLAKRAEGDLQTASSYLSIERSFNRVQKTQKKIMSKADFYEHPFEGGGIYMGDDGLGALMYSTSSVSSEGEEVSLQASRNLDDTVSGGKVTEDSRTNVEEQGVAEADKVLADNGYFYACHEEIEETLETKDSWIYIMKPRDDGFETVDKVPASGLGMTRKSGYMPEGGLFVEGNTLLHVEGREDMCVVTCFDISNPLSPVRGEEMMQSGTYKKSYMTDGKLIVVSGISQEDMQDSSGDIHFEPDSMSNKPWMYTNMALEPKDIYMQRDLYAPGFTVIGSYLVENGECRLADGKAMTGPGDRIYMNGSNLYILNEVVAKRFDKVGRTGVAKFVIDEDGKIEGRAHRVVDGWLGKGFSVKEQKGHLRLCTSVSHYKPEWKWTKVEVPFDWYMLQHYTAQLKMVAGLDENSRDMSVYVLDDELKDIGRLDGICEGSTIQNARFAGECLYIVGEGEQKLVQVNLVAEQLPELMDSVPISGEIDYLHTLQKREDILIALGKDVSGELMLTIYETAAGKGMQQIESYPLIQRYSGAMQKYTQILVQETEDGFYLGFATQNASGLQYPLLFYRNGQGVETILRSESKFGTDYWCRGMFFDGQFWVLRDCARHLQIEQYEQDSFRKLGVWKSE